MPVIVYQKVGSVTGTLIALVGEMKDVVVSFKFFFNLHANIHLFKVNNPNTRKVCEIYSKLIIKTLE